MNRFLVVMTGRNHPDWAWDAIDSVLMQDDRKFDVAAVDDAGEESLAGVFSELGVRGYRNPERMYGTWSQKYAWEVLEPSEGDVVVWVDLDDRLADYGVLSRLRAFYEETGCLMTYGSYRPFPADHPNAVNCRPAAPYNPMIRGSRGYRAAIQWFNHLRSVSWDLLQHVTDEDLQRSDGTWWKANVDRAVMFPCLEMAGERVGFVPDILYEYRCDSPDAVWRSMNELLVEEDRELRRRPMKEVLCES